MYQLKEKIEPNVHHTSVLFELPDSAVRTDGIMSEKATNALRQGGQVPYSNKEGFAYYFFKYTGSSLYEQFTVMDVAGLCTPPPTGLGGEVYNYGAWIEVDPSVAVPVGIRNSEKTDEQGNTTQKTWSEWANNLVTKDDGKSYVSSRDQATGTSTTDSLKTGLYGTEILVLVSGGYTVLTKKEYQEI